MYIDDIQEGAVLLRFSNKTHELHKDDLDALRWLITLRRKGSPADTPTLRLILLLPTAADKLNRMDRIASLAHGLASAGISCRTLEIACIEDSGMIASRMTLSPINTPRRKRKAPQTHLILTSVTSSHREHIDQNLAFLGHLCNFIPE